MTNQGDHAGPGGTSRPPRPKLPPLSFQRKLNQVSLFSVVTVVLSVAVVAMVHLAFEGIADDVREVAGAGALDRVDRWRGWLLAAAGACGLIAVAAAWRSIAAANRADAVETSVRRMGRGNLDESVEVRGDDEFSRQGEALEALRRRSLQVVGLQLVEQTEGDLRRRSDELAAATAELAAARDQIVARQALVEIGELASGVALEIQTPLSYMDNFTLVSQELFAELTDTLEKKGRALDVEAMSALKEIVTDIEGNMERLARHSRRANDVVARTIALARTDGEVQPTDLNELVSFYGSLGCHSAKALDAGFTILVEEDLDPEVGQVSVAAESMARVMLNLVGNACHAVSERRRLEASDAYVPTLRLGTKRREDRVEIRIRDNGIGIPEDARERVLTPFYTTKRPENGTGLGLSRSVEVVRRHRGSLKVESEPGRSTTVTVSLPGL